MVIRIRGVAARSVPSVLRGAERLTLTAAACLLTWPLFVVVESAFAQWAGERELARAAQSSREAIVERKPSKPVAGTHPKAGSVVGKFQMPRLKLSYVLLEGTASRTLDKSIGHVEGTAMIGQAGNIAIAGHRNTHFRKLEWIRRGDEVILIGAGRRISLPG